ncbi:MAG: H4MPT-linked C1 transfer pathway protein, partial [Planctomycetota bacterium]|nr:H4MPT-linked C1 transfer pathway protein [Planctomycetota bacterium]
ELKRIVLALPRKTYDMCGLTMTGELADCFATKREGVAQIVGAAELACDLCGPLRVYGNDGAWHSATSAREQPHCVAAANWHALANWLGRSLDGQRGLLVDMGSTTVDLIPLTRKGPGSRGITDTQRLQYGELLYTGAVRSPICAVVRQLPYRGVDCPVAAELFATTLDAYLVLRRLPEDAQRCDTADGRPRTRNHAIARLARMLCADGQEFIEEDAIAAAEAVARAQTSAVAEALDWQMQRGNLNAKTLIVSGEGEFVVRDALRQLGNPMKTVSLSELWGNALSRVAPAYALAKLLQLETPRE